MGLFDAKYCSVCGEKIGLLGNRKLEDGNLCKNCASKLSPFMDDRRHSTVDTIKEHLAYREQNKQQLSYFNPTLVLGNGTKVYIDQNAGTFAVSSASDWRAANPDIININQVTSVYTEPKEHKREIYRKDSEGHSVSYNPKRYEYSYEFRTTINVNSPYFDDISFELSQSSKRPSSINDLQYRNLEQQGMQIQQALSGGMGMGMNGMGMNGMGMNQGMNGMGMNQGMNGMGMNQGMNGMGMNQGMNGMGMNGNSGIGQRVGSGIGGVAGSVLGQVINAAENGLAGSSMSMNQQGMNGMGMNQQGMNGMGMNQQGMNGMGMNQGMNGMGMNQGMNGMGMNQGMNGMGMNQQGMNGMGMNQQGMNGMGMNQQGMNGMGMNQQGMNGMGMNQGMNGMGMNQQGMGGMNAPQMGASWTCEYCGTVNTGDICTGCSSPRS